MENINENTPLNSKIPCVPSKISLDNLLISSLFLAFFIFAFSSPFNSLINSSIFSSS